MTWPSVARTIKLNSLSIFFFLVAVETVDYFFSNYVYNNFVLRVKSTETLVIMIMKKEWMSWILEAVVSLSSTSKRKVLIVLFLLLEVILPS